MYRSATIASLSGGVIGSAGGITTVVGLCLAPVTLGASLIVSAVGIGVAVAGGVTSASSNISKEVKIKSIASQIQPLFEESVDLLQDVAKILERLKSINFEDIALTLGSVLTSLGLVVRIAIVGSKTLSLVGRSLPVLSSITLVLDVISIATDSKEIHEIRKRERGEPTDSKYLKAFNDLHKHVKELEEAIDAIKKELLDKINPAWHALSS